MTYVAEKMALHLVDKKELNGKKYFLAECSDTAQTVADLPEEVQKFLNEHVELICTCDKASDMDSAHFKKDSKVREWYAQLMAHENKFLAISKDLATELCAVSDGRVSPGLLMVLLFRSEDPTRKFLGLFKLDPFRESLIKLDSSTAGLYVLDVEEIAKALPKANSNRVLKCAVVGHPTSKDYDLKFRDHQGGGETAQYFGEFLGCYIRSSDKKQMQKFFKSIEEYLQKNNKSAFWLEKAPVLISEFSRQARPLDFNDLVRTTQRVGVFPGRNTTAVKKILGEKMKPEEVYFSKDFSGPKTMTYSLPSGISINGPIGAMNDYVRIDPRGNNVTFRIRSTKNYRVTCE